MDYCGSKLVLIITKKEQRVDGNNKNINSYLKYTLMDLEINHQFIGPSNQLIYLKIYALKILIISSIMNNILLDI